MKRAGQTLLFLLCIFFTITAAYNVMSANAEVEAMASTASCGNEGQNCHPQQTRMERTPFAQTFEFVTAKRKVEVRCARAFVLVGEYACSVR